LIDIIRITGREIKLKNGAFFCSLKINKKYKMAVLPPKPPGPARIINGQPFYSHFYKSEGKLSLQDVFPPLEIATGFIISTDYPGSKPGGKFYTLFPNHIVYFNWHKDLDQKTFYESIQDGPQKMRLDMDYKLNTYETLESGERNMQIAQDLAIEEIFHVLQLTSLERDVIVLSASNLTEGKVSRHVIFQSKHLANAAQAKALFEIIHKKIKDKVSNNIIDSKVYSSFQQFRMLGCHKLGSKRVLREEMTWKYKDRIITHELNYPNYHPFHSCFFESLINIVMPGTSELCQQSFSPPTLIKNNTTPNHRPINREEPGEDSILNSINQNALGVFIREYITDKNDEIALVQGRAIGNLIRYDRIAPSWCQICDREHQHDNAYITIMGPKQLVWLHCCRASSEDYIYIGCLKPKERECSIPMEQILPFPVPDETYNSPKVESLLHLPETFCFMLQSAMGTGKTKAVIELIKDRGYTRICTLSNRIQFSGNMQQRMAAHGLFFHCYYDDPNELDKRDKIIVQMESTRLVDPFPPEHQYDLVLCDEIVSLLNQFNSPTMNGRILSCANAFSGIIGTAKCVLCLDAFLSVMAVDTMKYLRAAQNDVIVYRNSFTPNLGNVFIFNHYENFEKDIIAKVYKNEPSVAAIASKKKAEDLHKELLKVASGPVKLYSDNTDDKVKRTELGDLDKYWDKLAALIYTSTITVGASFEKPHYEHRFLYSSSMAANFRDSIQSVMRVRDVKNPALYYTAFNNYFLPDRSSLFLDANQIKEQMIKSGELAKLTMPANGVGMRWEPMPSWLLNVLIHCKLEANLSKVKHEAVAMAYFKFCGYNILSMDDEKQKGLEGEEIVTLAEQINYEDKYLKIPNITDDQARLISAKMRIQESSAEERESYKKYIFKKYVDESIARSNVGVLYENIWKKPNGENYIQNLQLEKQFDYNLLISRDVNKNQYLEKADNNFLKMFMISETLKVIKIKNSTQPVTMTYDEMASNEMRDYYLRVRNIAGVIFSMAPDRDDKLDPHNLSKKAGNLICQILFSWNGTTFEKNKKKDRTTRQGRKFNYTNYMSKRTIPFDNLFAALKG
jgi:hypothetical protein